MVKQREKDQQKLQNIKTSEELSLMKDRDLSLGRQEKGGACDTHTHTHTES